MRNLKNEIDHDGIFKRMDARLDGQPAEECGFGQWSALVVILLVVVINNRNKEGSRVQYLPVTRAVHPEMKTMPDACALKPG